jgi:hypothetical protein
LAATLTDMKRSRLAIAAVAAVIAGAAAVLAFARLADEEGLRSPDWRVENAYPSTPGLIGDRAVIRRGEDWAFAAWRSTRGLCTSLLFPEAEGATSCGMPIVGALRGTRAPEHLVVGGTLQRRPDDDLWVNGVAAANVRRVEVELADGRRLQAPLYDAPAALGLELKFFLVRARPPEDGARKAAIPESPVRAFSAYDAQGRLLERFGPPDVQKARLEAAILRYENSTRQRTWNPHRPAQVRAVDCRRPAPRFRGNPAFRCLIRFEDASAEFNCFALVGRALYQVGGCYDPLRDIGAGNGRLLSRSSWSQ